MVKSVGLSDYDSTAKKQWRVWTWNRITKKLKIPAKDAVGLYFAAAQDLDRPVAIRKGINPNNLIAVERDIDSVKALRKKKVNVINGDLCAAIRDWSDTKPSINFINADFTCGITNSVRAFLALIFASDWVSHNGVVAFNLLRGRDKGLTELHQSLFAENSIGSRIVMPKLLSKKKQNEIHRGQRLALAGLIHIGINLSVNLRFRKIKGEDEAFRHRRIYDTVIKFVKNCSPVFYSYKSANGRNVMDSCVFNIHKIGMYTPGFDYNKHAEEQENDSIENMCNKDFNWPDIKMKVAAAKAIRTMRIERTIDKYPQI